MTSIANQVCEGADCQGCEDCLPFSLAEEQAASEYNAHTKTLRDSIGPISQLSLSETFVYQHHGIIAWDRDGGVWRIWRFGNWREHHDILRDVAYHVRAMLPPSKPDAHKAWLNTRTFKSAAELAQSGLAGAFDAKPNLVGYAPFRALDTDTGDVIGVDWQHYISTSLPYGVVGDTAQPSDEWCAFVYESLSHYDPRDREAVSDYIQEWCGSALTGDTRDEAMLFLYGRAGTGKSTFVETIQAAFGEYAASVSGSRIASEASQHLQWKAGLRGKRLLSINEIPDRGRWQSDSLNQLVSGEVIEANRMRADSVNFRSQLHVMATGNHKPRAGAASGIWRRLRIVEFQHKPETPDKGLKDALRGPELPGVFAWLLEGLDRWIGNGRSLGHPSRAESGRQGVPGDG